VFALVQHVESVSLTALRISSASSIVAVSQNTEHSVEAADSSEFPAFHNSSDERPERSFTEISNDRTSALSQLLYTPFAF
jgi:hypothetical protein